MVLSFRNHAVHANVAMEDNAESISPELNQMVLDLLLVDLRHADDLDEDGHTDAVAMRKILTTMKVTGIDNPPNPKPSIYQFSPTCSRMAYCPS